MKEPQFDPERLAALLDGRLDPREREALLAELGESEDMRELLGDAAAILRELEPEEAGAQDIAEIRAPDIEPARPPVDAPVTPPPEPPVDPVRGAIGRNSTRSTRTIWWRFGMLAAAVVLGAVGLTLYMRKAGSTFDTPTELVARLPVDAPPVAAPHWAVTRGGTTSLTPRARAVRVGTMLVNIGMASRARDSAAVSATARQAAVAFDDVVGGGMIAQVYDQTAVAAGSSPYGLGPTMDDLFTQTVQLLDSTDVRTGAWLGAARIAAASHTDTFFRQRASRRAIAEIAARPDLGPDQRIVAGRIRDVVDGGGSIDWPALTRDLAALLAALGS